MMEMGNWVNADWWATMLSVSTKTVDRLWRNKILPPPVKFGRQKRWRLSTAMQHLADMEREAVAAG
jgi:hypothetical protein